MTVLIQVSNSLTGSLDTEAEDLAADEQVAKLFEVERLDGKVSFLYPKCQVHFRGFYFNCLLN